MFKWLLNSDSTVAHMAGKKSVVDGKKIIEAAPPDGGFIKPKWDGDKWVDSATAADKSALLPVDNGVSNGPTAEQIAINQLGMMVASLAAKVAK